MKELLVTMKLPKATYYDRLKRNKRVDKYSKIKAFITNKYHQMRETYGYRRIHCEALKAGFSYSQETIRRIMGQLGLKVSLYSKHTSKYHSYKGTIGKIAPNLLQQKFNAKAPLTVLHTDVTQIRLATGRWGYVSAVIDEASHEVLAVQVGNSPSKSLIKSTIDKLKTRIVPDSKPILHSDQGWQYQVGSYQKQLEELDITQSMSRKGNCHDNAPIESFFSLLKRECLNRFKINKISALSDVITEYVEWFNNERISLNYDGLTPVEYRERRSFVART